MRKVILTVLVSMVVSLSVFAQKTVVGKVSDANGKPISNASVLVKGTKVGTSTAADGSYSIQVPANGKVLEFSSLSFETQSVTIGNKVSISPTLTAADSKDNSTTKTRSVIVKNDAEAFFASSYNANETDALGPYTYSGNSDASKVVTVTASKSKNNRVWINRLGDFANNKIYMDITSTTIDIPQQTVSNVGTGTAANCEIHNRKTSGTGSKTATGFTLTYSDEKLAPCNGNRANVAATFTKK